MSMVFRFRMLSDENDAFVRDYEVMYDSTLAAFNDFILDSLGYERTVTSFFTADAAWERVREFTLEDMGAGPNDEKAPLPMAEVTLGQVIHRKRDRLIFQFDLLGDRAFYLELAEARPAEEGVQYPRVALAEGEAPDQYDASVPAAGSIFDEAMADFSDFEGDDAYDDEY